MIMNTNPNHLSDQHSLAKSFLYHISPGRTRHPVLCGAQASAGKNRLPAVVGIFIRNLADRPALYVGRTVRGRQKTE